MADGASFSATDSGWIWTYLAFNSAVASDINFSGPLAASHIKNARAKVIIDDTKDDIPYSNILFIQPGVTAFMTAD